jgi:hypothetical protein
MCVLLILGKRENSMGIAVNREMLSVKDLEILHGLIGKRFNGIVSPSVSTKFGSSTYTLDITASFNFVEKEPYIVFSCHHLETESGIDFWRLEVEESMHPKNVGHEKIEELGYALTGNMGMINIWSNIEKITVFTYHYEDEEEILEYDKVLLFSLENGQQIGMTHNVFFISVSSDPDEIEEMKEGCYERVRLE